MIFFLCMMCLDMKQRRNGFTMLELIIVLVLIGILAALLFAFYPRYRLLTRDSQRKADLKRLKTAFEDYAGDNECYPPPHLLANCGSADFHPYLKSVLCEPGAKQPYLYVRSTDCLSYSIYTQLENPDDDAVTGAGCQSGCGPGSMYNYGVSGGGSGFIGVTPGGGEVSPTCANSSGVMRCIPGGSCGSCCPGAGYQCNSRGDACVFSATCN